MTDKDYSSYYNPEFARALDNLSDAIHTEIDPYLERAVKFLLRVINWIGGKRWG
jgi:hypothetical protein